MSTMTSTGMIKANGWPVDYVDSIGLVRVLLDRHGAVELQYVVVAVLEARDMFAAAGTV
jgi:hypothetical protein